MPESRSASRERALSLLYEAESKGVGAAAVLEGQPAGVDEYAASVLAAVARRAGDVDTLIRRFAVGWELERMPVMDRCLLRLAIAELLELLDVPPGVVLSEAVLLAQRYSTEASGRFINGLLSQVAREVR